MSRTAALLAACAVLTLQAKERVYYLDFEHPSITYVNPRYFRAASLVAQRYGRRDPIHYVHMHFETLVALGNNFTVDAYVYEFLSNEYRRSFLETHFKVCDIFEKTRATFLDLYQFINYKSCPFPKGVYHFTNVSFPDVPQLKTFPFTKGRLFVNGSLTSTGEPLSAVYADVVIKQRWR